LICFKFVLFRDQLKQFDMKLVTQLDKQESTTSIIIIFCGGGVLYFLQGYIRFKNWIDL